MKPEIEKMVKMAQSRGSLSAAQREMIINKARELGDDAVEVEFILSAIPENGGANTQAQQGPTTSQQQQQSYQQQAYQQQTYQQQPAQQQYAQPNAGPQKPPLATAAFILSIVSPALALIGLKVMIFIVLGLAAGIVALVFSIKSKKLIAENPAQFADKNIMTAFILSIVGTALCGVMFLFNMM